MMTPDQIRAAFREANVSQAALTRQYRLHSTLISNVISRRKTSHRVRMIIANSLDIPFDQMWGPPTRVHPQNPPSLRCKFRRQVERLRGALEDRWNKYRGVVPVDSAGMDRHAINAALHRRDVTQTALARRLRVDVSLVSRVIAGSRSTPRVRRAIARALGKPQSAIWPVKSKSGRKAA